MLQKIKVKTVPNDGYQYCNVHGENFVGKLIEFELPIAKRQSQTLRLCSDCLNVYQTVIQLAQTGKDMDSFFAEKTFDTKVLEVK